MKNKKVYGLVGVAALAAVGGTFAYYSATQTFSNPFNTTNYGSQATERFNPADGNKWEPGAKVNKDVYATNTGDGEVWVRVKFGEVWTLADGSTKPLFSNTTEDGTTRNPLFDIVKPDNAPTNWVPNADSAHQTSQTNGVVAEDGGTVVYKEYADVVDAISNSDKGWVKGDDGYYYYNVALEKGEQSGKLLDSVTLAGNADMGHFTGKYAYLKTPKGTIDVNAPAPVYPRAPEGYAWQEVNDELLLPVLPVKPVADDYENVEDYNKAIKDYEDAVKAFDTNWPNLANQDVFTYKANVLDQNAQGYANAKYNLDITVEFVQTDAEAAKGLGWDSTIVTDLATKLAAKKAATTTPTTP